MFIFIITTLCIILYIIAGLITLKWYINVEEEAILKDMDEVDTNIILLVWPIWLLAMVGDYVISKVSLSTDLWFKLINEEKPWK